jgi:chromosome segregation ATPase
MSRSHTRKQIVDYLVRHGSLDDPQGRATAKLREALGYGGSEASFTQLISTMDKAGQLAREIKGKRTYRIRAVADAPSLSDSNLEKSNDAAETVEMDYDQVASALLVQVVQTLTQGPRGKESDGSWVRRRVDRLERRIDELERDLTHAKAESKGIANERDELRLQLEHSQGNLSLLTDRLSTGKSREGHVSKLLGPDERALLHQLRSGTSSDRPGRAG